LFPPRHHWGVVFAAGRKAKPNRRWRVGGGRAAFFKLLGHPLLRFRYAVREHTVHDAHRISQRFFALRDSNKSFTPDADDRKAGFVISDASREKLSGGRCRQGTALSVGRAQIFSALPRRSGTGGRVGFQDSQWHERTKARLFDSRWAEEIVATVFFLFFVWGTAVGADTSEGKEAALQTAKGCSPVARATAILYENWGAVGYSFPRF